MQELLDGIQASFIGVTGAIIAFLPNLLAAIVLLIVGWLLGKLLGAIVTKVLRAVRFNEVADRAEIDTFIEKAGVRAGPSAVVGGIVRWAVYLVFFLAAFAALGLPQVSVLINSLIAYLPKVAVAVIVLLVGALVGKVMAGIVRGTLGSMGMGNPDLFANVARFAVIAFAVIAALDILEIAPTVVSALWIAFLALIVGSVALAFGLGGREAASHLMLGRMLRAEVEPEVEVTAGNYHGKLVTIGSLLTTIETQEGIVKVPNSQLTGQAVQMDQRQYQWQVQKRQELKQRATDGMRQQHSNQAQPGSRRNGEKEDVVHARAAIAEQLSFSETRLTRTKEGNELEDELNDLWRRIKGTEGKSYWTRAAARLQDIDQELGRLEVPFEEWEVLFRTRLLLERGLLGAIANFSEETRQLPSGYVKRGGARLLKEDSTEGKIGIDRGSVVGIITGVLIGALAGLLLAPKPGKETRQRVQGQANKYAVEIRSRMGRDDHSGGDR